MHSITLDWLAMTFKELTNEQAEFLDNYALLGASDTTKPTNGYREACTGSHGVVHMWHPDRKEMGHHVIFSGTTLRDVFKTGDISQQTLLERVMLIGARITRIDIACDTQNVSLSLDEIYKALERGEHIGTARTFSQIHSLNGGNTIYVGSRTSDKFVRIYDKAAQQGFTGGAWYRFEFEAKGAIGRAIATVLCKTSDWSSTFRACVTPMVDIPSCGHFRALLPEAGAQIGIPKLEKKTDREKWIEMQVMPAVVDHYVQHRDSNAVALLRRMLDEVDKMK